MRSCEWLISSIKLCGKSAVIRVRLFESDETTTDMDLCREHVHDAAGEYPDNIKTVEAIE